MCCEDFDEDYNDCIHPFVIRENEYNFEYWGYNVDSYLETGWTITNEGFSKSNSYWDIMNTYPTFPTRYRLNEFKLSKSLRRVLNKNSDLKILVRPFRSTKQKEKLSLNFLHGRFDTTPDNSLENHFLKYRYAPLKIMEVSVFKGRKLLAGSIFIVTPNSIQSSIGFWDINEYSRSLGILTVLVEMQYAIRKRKQFYYLGFYYIQNDNYAYKSRFPALELWDWANECWVDFQSGRVPIMLTKKLPCKDDIQKEKIPDYIKQIRDLVGCRKGVFGIAIIGQHSQSINENNWYIQSLCVANEDEYNFVKNSLIFLFGRVCKVFAEQWGDFNTIRVLYKNNVVLEFNFIKPEKILSPVSEELYCILKDGLSILYDPQNLLITLQNAVLDE